MSRRRHLIAVTLLAVVSAAFGILTLKEMVDIRVSAFAFVFISYGFVGIVWLIIRPLLEYSQPDSLERQVQTLSESLRRAGEISAFLSAEIGSRKTELERLATQSVVAKRILSELSQEEYDAVIAAIRAQSRTERAKELTISFVLGVATNVVTFFMLRSV